MNRWWHILVLGALSAASRGQVVQSAELAETAVSVRGPRLVFQTKTHDFGKIPDTDVVSFDFCFTNQGDEPLVFRLPLPRGGNPRSARNPSIDQDTFAPGEGGYIRVWYNPSGKQGEFKWRVQVESNDPEQPQQILSYSAFVKPEIVIDPLPVDFGRVPIGETRSQVVKVTGKGADFKVTYASTSKGRYLRVKVLGATPVVVDGDQMTQCTLELTLNGAAPRGRLEAVTTLRTTSERLPLTDFGVTAEIVDEPVAQPPR